MTYLQTARQQRGLTQGQLAKRCGLRQSILSRIESGKREISFAEATRLAEALHMPLEWFVNGKERPGSTLSEIAQELWHFGMVDLMVAQARVPGTYRSVEEVLTCAVGTEKPDPRVIEALPAVLAWNRFRPGVLDAFARVAHPKALTRLAWLIDVTLILHRTGGFPGEMVSFDDLMQFLPKVVRPHEPDTLGQIGEMSSEHHIWKYWLIHYHIELSAFKERADRLWLLRNGGKNA